MTNDYKPDDGKPPVLDAVDIPFRRALLAIARMAQDMAVKHKLLGAADPFNEWRHLPDARRRLANAAARHSKHPWQVNTADGSHLHITHATWGWLAALELWEEEQEKIDAEAPCCAAPDATVIGYTSCMAERQGHACRLPVDHNGAHAWPDMGAWGAPGTPEAGHTSIHGPAGADWREGPNGCNGGRAHLWNGFTGRCTDCGVPNPDRVGG